MLTDCVQLYVLWYHIDTHNIIEEVYMGKIVLELKNTINLGMKAIHRFNFNDHHLNMLGLPVAEYFRHSHAFVWHVNVREQDAERYPLVLSGIYNETWKSLAIFIGGTLPTGGSRDGGIIPMQDGIKTMWFTFYLSDSVKVEDNSEEGLAITRSESVIKQIVDDFDFESHNLGKIGVYVNDFPKQIIVEVYLFRRSDEPLVQDNGSTWNTLADQLKLGLNGTMVSGDTYPLADTNRIVMFFLIMLVEVMGSDGSPSPSTS